jgi:hypothetical protein
MKDDIKIKDLQNKLKRYQDLKDFLDAIPEQVQKYNTIELVTYVPDPGSSPSRESIKVYGTAVAEIREILEDELLKICEYLEELGVSA